MADDLFNEGDATPPRGTLLFYNLNTQYMLVMDRFTNLCENLHILKSKEFREKCAREFYDRM